MPYLHMRALCTSTPLPSPVAVARLLALTDALTDVVDGKPANPAINGVLGILVVVGVRLTV